MDRFGFGIAPARIALGGILLCAAALGACGETRTERGLTGGAIGAGVGAAGAAVAGGNLLPAAAVGAVVGGAVGALTDKSDISLGD